MATALYHDFNSEANCSLHAVQPSQQCSLHAVQPSQQCSLHSSSAFTQFQPSQQCSLHSSSAFTAVQPTRKQCTLFDVGMKTVLKEMSSRSQYRLDPQSSSSRNIGDRHIRTESNGLVSQLTLQTRKDAQRGKRGPYASGLGRWPQHLKSLAIERHSRRYPVWLNIPMKTNNGQPARGVWGPGVLSTIQLRHLKLNFDAFAKLSEKTLENWLWAHKITWRRVSTHWSAQKISMEAPLDPPDIACEGD
eukprot:Em0020g925a